MAYTAPYIDNTGLHTNTYSDILDYLVGQMKSIFGEDLYLGTDSQDYQMISVIARAIYEEEQCAQMNYQARSIATASTDDVVDALVTLMVFREKKLLTQLYQLPLLVLHIQLLLVG